jgi:hypothetical protein
MHILHTASKGRLLNTIENFYIHRETTANNQLNEKMITKPNNIFDVILQHTQPPDVTHNTTNRSPTTATAVHTRHQPPPHHTA